LKTFKILIFITIAFILIGCSEQPTIERVVTVTKEVEVKVPVKPKRQKLHCDFTGEGATPISKAIECIALHKRYIEKITVE